MLIVALLAASPVNARTETAIKPICRNPGVHAVAGRARPGAHALAAEPPARHIKAVVREIDGCNRPVVVADRVGMEGR
ncbi:MAG: hypothetical protein M3R41_03475 [Pseudomonadota bacterium]|nr:hypothetical protein [Pseudomonadota bacterium]